MAGSNKASSCSSECSADRKMRSFKYIQPTSFSTILHHYFYYMKECGRLAEKERPTQ
jgi:hypothetical protein